MRCFRFSICASAARRRQDASKPMPSAPNTAPVTTGILFFGITPTRVPMNTMATTRKSAAAIQRSKLLGIGRLRVAFLFAFCCGDQLVDDSAAETDRDSRGGSPEDGETELRVGRLPLADGHQLENPLYHE